MLEVTFADGVLGEEDRDRVRWAVGRIDVDGEGAWRHPVRHAKVLKAFGAGRSGGLALRVELAFEGHALTRVVKVDKIAVMEREWLGYRRISSMGNAVFAPIVAASCDVVDPGRRSRLHDYGAVVYGDAAEFDGDPAAATWTLAEVAADPTRVGEAVNAIERLFKGSESAFYKVKRVDRDESSLARMNRRLGPALVIRSEGGPAAPKLPHEILRRTTAGVDSDIGVGQRIGFELSEQHPLTIVVDDEVASAGSGVVLASRGLTSRGRLPEPALPCADPFAALLPVLTTSLNGRVTCRSHGDLNASNVLVIGGRPYLIDYAEFEEDTPQQLDFSWLEVSLLRDVYAERDPAGLIRLQRALAVGSRLLQLGVGADEALHACQVLTHVDNHDALRVLLAIRVQAHRLYPEEAQPDWWRDHQAQLLLSAHRTLKWPAHMQSVAKLHAVTAVAAVATEWLTDGDPFHLWDEPADQAKAELRRHLRRAWRARSPQVATELRTEHYLELAANDSPSVQKSLALSEHVVLTGETGSGKTTVLREFARHLVSDDSAPMPLFVHARDFAWSSLDPEDGRLGVVQLIIDDASPELLTDLRSRYPDMPILASGSPTDGFEHVRLNDLNEHAIERYLWRRVPQRNVDQLMYALLNDRAWRRLDIRRPRVLSLLADYVTAHGIPDSAIDVYQAMLLAKVGGDETAIRSGETLALNLLDSIVPAAVDPKLIHAGVVVVEDGYVRFADDSDRDHLAACALLRSEPGPNELARRIGAEHWRNALAVFVSLPEVSSDSVTALVEAALDPTTAAVLLASTSNCPWPTLERFASTQQAYLRSGGQEASNARAVLVALGQPEVLSEVVADSEASAGARWSALSALFEVWRQARPGYQYRIATTELVRAFSVVLSDGTDATLSQDACTLLQLTGLKELGLLVADQVSASNPWPLTRSAMHTLRRLGMMPTRSVLEAYSTACRDRMAHLDRLLRKSRTVEKALTLRSHEVGLFDELSGEDQRKWFHRLRFGLGVPTDLPCDAPPCEGGPDEWLDLIEHGSAEQATLAGHHLLAAAPDRVSEILDRIGRSPSGDRLLIAAVVLTHNDLQWAERLLCQVLSEIAPSDLEGPAALLIAIFHLDRRRGIRLALVTARILIGRDLSERHFWPWSAAMAACHGGPADHEALINEGSLDLAIDALSSYGFLLSGERGPRHMFGPSARARLLAARTGENLADWAHAAATARLTGAVPVIREHVAAGYHEPIVLRALGYLVMLRAEANPNDPEIERCLPLLSTPDGQVYRQQIP